MKLSQSSLKDALLHDTHHAWEGSLEKVTDYGCEMRVLADEAAVGPHAQRNAQLRLQVLTKDGSDAEEIAVELDGIRRIGDTWVYRLTWATAA